MQASRKDSIPLAVRKLVYKRDAWCCVRCGLFVMGQPHNVHHRIRRSQLGPHSPENLILLCGSGTTGCHGWVHANPKVARLNGWLLRSGDIPLLTTVSYVSNADPDRYQKRWLTPDGEPPAGVAA
jgi:hypothetical protein